MAPLPRRIFCLSLKLSIFLASSRHAMIFPICKHSGLTDPNNCHPISLTPVIQKEFGTAISDQLPQFLHCEALLNDDQYGFDLVVLRAV